MGDKVKIFSLSHYVEEALKLAEYAPDETGVIIGKVPGMSGFFSQGDSFEEARGNLKEAIEGNLLLALQLGWEIPRIEGVDMKIEECGHAKTHSSQG